MHKLNGFQGEGAGKLWEYLRWNSYLSEKYRMLYVATPKVACTTLKWWFAELEGCNEARFAVLDSGESDPELVIHDTFYRAAPTITGLKPDALARPLSSAGYYRFAVVRNPYKRIFSAFQSKLLLQEGLQSSPYETAEFFQAPIRNAEEVATAFEGFLEYICKHEAPAFADVHWTPQVNLLRPDLIEYARIARIEERKQLEIELQARTKGAVSQPFEGQRKNVSLIPYMRELFTARSTELIRQMYAPDFAAFGYDTGLPPNDALFSRAQFEVAAQGIHLVRGRNRRLYEMSKVINRLKQGLPAQPGQETAGAPALAEMEERLASQNELLVQQQDKIAELTKQLSLLKREMIGAEAQLTLLKDILLQPRSSAR